MRTAFLACFLGALGLVAATAAGGCGSDSSTSAGNGDGGFGPSGSDGGGGGNSDGGNGNQNGTDGGSQSGSDGGGGGSEGGTTTSNIKTVFIIMMENHSWSTISKSTSAKYINDATNGLIGLGGHAENYSTPKGNHPSEPNYIWLESGDNLGITDDNPPADNHQSTKDHLVTQLETAGFTWKAYVEAIDGKTCPLTDNGDFATKHTPMLFFDDVTDTNTASSKHCTDHVRPFTELATDLSGGTVANYNFITPNLCDDMHGEVAGPTCFATTDSIKAGDDWLKANVPTILGSAAYKSAGALFIIWDEGDEAPLQTASDGPVPVFVLSPFGKPGFKSTTTFTHSSTLKTVEEIFGLPQLRDAKNATDLSEFFMKFP
jgi:phospholipase C